MNRPRLVYLSSTAELRASAAAWDDLWWRSEVTLPTVRAELVAQWVEQFAPGGDFRVLAVEDDRQWVAALPLVRTSRYKLFGTGVLPSNEWSSSGDLLLDADAEVDAALDVLVAALRRLPWQLLWLDGVPLDSPRWKALQEAVDRAAVGYDRRQQLQVGMIEVDHDWEAYTRRWSKKHRRKIARADTRLAEQGDVRFEMHSQLQHEQVEPWMRRAFEIEDRSWKGKAGSSVLRTPGMFDFFLRQAEQLAQWEQLQLAFLECGRRPAAFIYALSAKGVCHWHKIGYDPEFRGCSPGQLLQHHVLKKFFGEPERRAVDTMGPLTDALAKWKPSPYTVGRLVVAPRRLLGRVALYFGKHWWPKLRRLRGGKESGGPKNGNGHKPPSCIDQQAPVAV